MTDEEIIAASIAQMRVAADQQPGVTIIHNIRTMTVEYMCELGLTLLQTTPEELRALGPAYYTRFFNAAESAEYVPQLWALLANNDYNTISSFFQQVRTTQQPDWSLYFTAMRLLARGADGQPLLVVFFACPIDPNHHVAMKVQRLLDENNFLRRHTAIFAQLTSREREVLRHLELGQSSPDIAATLYISVQTADTHRRNIRRKLGATTTFELGQFARAFDLI